MSFYYPFFLHQIDFALFIDVNAGSREDKSQFMLTLRFRMKNLKLRKIDLPDYAADLYGIN